MEAEGLQSVVNVYFDARAVEDEEIDENYSDYSDDSADECTDRYSQGFWYSAMLRFRIIDLKSQLFA